MPRLLLFVALALLLTWLILRIVRFAKTKQFDWKGAAIAVGFVALALYLRHTTGVPSLL